MLRILRLAIIPLLVAVAAIQLTTPTAHADYSVGHDNSTAPHNWTHGDPNTGDAPGFGSSGDGYYYLKAYSAGTAVWCEVYTGGAWLIQLETSSKHVIAQVRTVNAGGRVFTTHAHPGSLYFCRISDVGAQPLKDYAELNSGNPGDVTNSDCGGPGPVVDPNFNEAPMEPAETPGMPVNGCAQRTTVPYAAGDPRLSLPPQQSADLGPIVNHAAYRFTVAQACDLTASAFYGHQGHPATLAITDLAGNIVNSVKWGAMEANPDRATQEFVGADAGMVAPGTYVVHYAGPANDKSVYAICSVPAGSE